MFDFFDQVLGILNTAWTFFTNIINSLILAFDTLSNAVMLPAELALFMPSVISSCVIIMLALAVVKFLVGR